MVPGYLFFFGGGGGWVVKMLFGFFFLFLVFICRILWVFPSYFALFFFWGGGLYGY